MSLYLPMSLHSTSVPYTGAAAKMERDRLTKKAQQGALTLEEKWKDGLAEGGTCVRVLFCLIVYCDTGRCMCRAHGHCRQRPQARWALHRSSVFRRSRALPALLVLLACPPVQEYSALMGTRSVPRAASATPLEAVANGSGLKLET